MSPSDCDGCGWSTPEGSNLKLDWKDGETVEVRLCASCRRVVAKHCGVPDPGEVDVVAASDDD
jgi:hypothetical protein